MSGSSHSYSALIARFYDTVYAHVRSGSDYGFYMEAIRLAGGPVLEVGAGTGRFFRDALGSGADVYAIEPSPAMLGKLKEGIDPSQFDRVFLADAQGMDLEPRFALVIAPFRVFGHIMDTDGQLAALRNIHRHLREGGRFIFDLFVPDPAMIASGLQGVTDFDGEWTPGRRLRRTIDMHSDIVRQVSTVTMRFDWEEEDGWHSDSWTSDLRYYFRYELEMLLSQSPFSSYRIMGDFEGGELGTGSREFVVECRK